MPLYDVHPYLIAGLTTQIRAKDEDEAKKIIMQELQEGTIELPSKRAYTLIYVEASLHDEDIDEVEDVDSRT